MSYLFIGHDLATVAHISHRIAVMYLGKIVEVADSQELSRQSSTSIHQGFVCRRFPAHPDEAREGAVIAGEVPVPSILLLQDAIFIRAAPYAMPHCTQDEPALTEVAPRHAVACHLY